MAKPKKYIVIDCEQDGEFCHWTWEDPQTRSQIITIFHDFSKGDGMNYKRKEFDFEMIQDIWNVRICLVDMPLELCPECECPMRRDICPNCGKE
jgi:hypothetical protein